MTTARVYRLDVTWPHDATLTGWHRRTRFLSRSGTRDRADRYRQKGATVTVVASEPIRWPDDPLPDPIDDHEPIPGQHELPNAEED